MAKPVRLTERQADILIKLGQGWSPVLSGSQDARLSDRMAAFGLVLRHREHNGAWLLRYTTLGGALGAAIHRARGGKLKRSGVQALAKHRREVFERFDVRHAASLPDRPFAAAIGACSRGRAKGRKRG